MSKPYIFYIDGMSCTSCSGVIENHLRKNKALELEYFHVDLTTPDPKKTTIIFKEHHPEHKANWLHVKEQIEEVGFNCRAYEYEPNQDKASIPPKKPNSFWEFTKRILSSHWFLGTIGCGLGVAFLITFLATSGLPLAAMIAIGAVSSLLTLALGAHSYYDAWKKLTKSKTLTMDSLFTISTLTIIAVSIASFFVPWLPMMFEAGLLIYGFRHIGLAIEETLKEKISSAQFQDRAPKTVRLILDSGLYELPLSAIQPDHIIEVHPGEVIPLDGICQEEGLIYNTIVSGSPLPRYYRNSEKVFAGMLLAEQTKPIKIKVLHTAKDSYLARLDRGIAQSIHEKAPLEIKTQKLLTYFIPAVIGFALLSGLMVGLFFPAAVAIQCAVSVLVSACPCTLGLIIPLAVKTGRHKAAEYGVHFTNSKALQELEQLDTILFDLHGTLTTGIPSVKKYGIATNAGCTPEHLLSICASLEAKATHPIGKEIYTFVKAHDSQTTVEHLNDKHHAGITGIINGEEYSIGGLGLMREKGVVTEAVDQQLNMEAGDSVVYLAKGQQLLGYVVMTDPLRKDALKTINALKQMGKEIHICTGADEKTARRCAKALGIEHVYANSVATTLEAGDRSKPDYIKLLQKSGKKVAMFGDAPNDAGALAASNLGIAMLSPNTDELTQQHAGAVIQNGTLMPLANAFAVSKQTVNNINQNLLMSLGYNIGSLLISGGLLVALGFTLNPAIGAALMAIQACIILLNVYHFKHKTLPHLTEKYTDEPIVESLAVVQQKTSLENNLEMSHQQSKPEEEPSFFSSLFNRPAPALREDEKMTTASMAPR